MGSLIPVIRWRYSIFLVAKSPVFIRGKMVPEEGVEPTRY